MDIEAANAEIRDAIAEYEAAIPAALARRDERIRLAVEASGMRQIDVIKVTGYSRETVRQALKPEARAAVRASVERRHAEHAERPTSEGRAPDAADGGSAG